MSGTPAPSSIRAPARSTPTDAPIEQKLCKKEACAIQWCLARRNHKEGSKDIAAWKATATARR